jgi:hypothetical protein
MCQTKVAEEIKTSVMFKNFFKKIVTFTRKREKIYGTARQATDDNTVQHFACWITKTTETHSDYVKRTVFPR